MSEIEANGDLPFSFWWIIRVHVVVQIMWFICKLHYGSFAFPRESESEVNNSKRYWLHLSDADRSFIWSCLETLFPTFSRLPLHRPWRAPGCRFISRSSNKSWPLFLQRTNSHQFFDITQPYSNQTSWNFEHYRAIHELIMYNWHYVRAIFWSNNLENFWLDLLFGRIHAQKWLGSV